MKTVIANRNDFFAPGCCPIALRTIKGDAAMQHPGDLTDIRHTHDFAELIFILRGGGLHWIDGKTYPVEEGDVFLIQGYTEHYFQERHNLVMYNVMFDVPFLKEHLHTLHSLPGFNAFFLFEPTYRRWHRFQSRLRIGPEQLFQATALLRQIEAVSEGAAPGYDLLMLAKVLEIFVFLSREYSKEKNPKARSLFRLGEVISRLENEYLRRWTIADLSRIAAMAPSTLLPVFRKVTGRSPMEYLMEVRLSKAAEKLLKTDDPVSEVAAACGFSDPNYFSRCFRRRYNASPREYRR
ncbi:MAG: helix-turn-helix domain-containing protein [Lentisphaeria bacterium]|nr:helix-turn-helix domain-containing protein [Lentisphaeria bacterium]